MKEAQEKQHRFMAAQYLLAVLTAILHGTMVPPLPQALDWHEIYTEARRQSLESMVLAGVEPQLQEEPELLAEWRKHRDANTVQTLTQISEQERVLAAFSAAGIPVLHVKGSVVRALYPRPEYRQMSDIDLLLHEEDLVRGRELLCTMGYQVRPSRHPELQDAELFLPPFMGVELHGTLIAHYDPDAYAEYYRTTDIWARAEAEPELPGVFHLRREDEYLYQLVHFLKHFESNGIGFRQVMDIYVCWHAWNAVLDETYLAGECRKLGIEKSRADVERLGRYCFGTEEERPQADETILRMQEDCILSGIYGTKEVWRLREVQKQQRTGGKLWKVQYCWQRLFPPIEYIRVRYPRLRTAPWLYPFYWLLRLVDFRYWKKHFRKEMLQVHQTDRKS